MKIKNLTSFFLLAMITLSGFSQLKVKNNGYVGIGTLDPLCRLHVMGEAYFQNSSFNTLRIVPGFPTVEIGSSSNRIDFWYAGVGYNRLFAKSFTKMSDIRLKEDIVGIPNCVATLQQLRPVNYLLLPDTETNKEEAPEAPRRDFGFIAQEVETILPEIVYESGKGLKGVDYNAVVPILVGAIQEQQKQIDELQKLVSQQNAKISGLNDMLQNMGSKQNQDPEKGIGMNDAH